ncbi:GNAT family N-acetyltransferase [Nocardia yunnanensis]|uniref:GNAT family N-acetyltransferase n=1 Tax=Nocardia yunnanensis TaxID=2382165 RepID=A0A386ZFZ6_9NOCA|nr:GNAT family N-acetyltransferase [Nocardia yunnanensis]AYF76380.1 GNAT family N-acetyltransferase [Nocardia yunnanensis]
MRIEITSDPVEFQARAGAFLDRDPLRHSVLCTILDNEISGLTIPEQPSFFASAHENEVVGVAMRTAGRGVWLGDLPEPAVPELVARFSELLPEIDDVHGDASAAAEFARVWSERHTTSYRAGRVERLYRLGALRTPTAPGGPRQATLADLELCARWNAAMAAELEGVPLALDDAGLRGRLGAGRWWLWEDGGRPVSLTAHQAAVRGWSRIGPVYTPPETRGRGYASALVAHVSGRLRTAGLDVCLYTDLGNPTSNKIYRAIGFEEVFDQVQYVFA